MGPEPAVSNGKQSSVTKATKALKAATKLLDTSKKSGLAKKASEKVNLRAILDNATGLRAWRSWVRTEVASAAAEGQQAFSGFLKLNNS